VNEIGARVVPDAATAKRQRGFPDSGRFCAGQTNVDGLGLHVETLLGDAGSMGPQELVAPRRTISTDDVNFRAGMAGGLGQIRKDIKEPRIEVVNLARAVVTQKPIQL
jgi:hypothetical protein